jgi:hypothetical protein
MDFNSAMCEAQSNKTVRRKAWTQGDFLVQRKAPHSDALILWFVSSKGQHEEPWRSKQEDVREEDWELVGL